MTGYLPGTGFQPFPKIPRLNRDIVITEKIDGTNAQVALIPEADIPEDDRRFVLGWHDLVEHDTEYDDFPSTRYGLLAGSRKRWLRPEKNEDNFGFAAWVDQWQAGPSGLVDTLGPGRHFGEWYGVGIQRGYGLRERRFALFNTKRWSDVVLPDGVDVVPVLHEGPFSSAVVRHEVRFMAENGSHIAPGFGNPEGVVVYHKASNQLFKVTCENDEQPKGQVAA
ncbi:MAG: RNA ligase family protein [Actinomycetota bacterium]